MIETSKKRDVCIWSAFVFSGLLLFANGIFGLVKIDGFDGKFAAWVVLSGCAVFSCYFADTKRSAYLIYPIAVVLQSLTSADLGFENVVLRSGIFALFIGLTVFLLIKYRNAKATKIVERKRLAEPVFSQINKYNLFSDMICAVGLLALLFGVSENIIFAASVAVAIVLVSLALVCIKQRYKRSAFGRQADVKEYVFVAFWLTVTLADAVVFRSAGHDLGYVALTIVVLMTDYFIFDRPLVIEKLTLLSAQ